MYRHWEHGSQSRGYNSQLRASIFWLRIVGGLRHGDSLPVLDGIDLNHRELIDA